jgi:hypothetical protein
MSEENVEIARRYLASTEAGMLGGKAVEALVKEFWEPDGDWYPVRRFPEARPSHGREEIVRFLTAIYGAWKDYRYVIKDARAIGDDRFLCMERYGQRDARAAWCWKATYTTASGSGMDDSSESRIT